MKKIIDTHNHLYFSAFTKPVEDLVQQAQGIGVSRQILIGVDELSLHAMIALQKKFPFDFRLVLGLHPCSVQSLGKIDTEFIYPGFENFVPEWKNFDDFFEGLEKLFEAHQDLILGFGETGFDQFHESSESLLRDQTESFERHLDLCLKYQKTLVIHSRGAKKETLDFLETHRVKFSKIRFVWHCFSEDWEAAQKVIDLGGYIGLGGIITYPKAENIRSIIKKIPSNHLITETDAPFLTPQKARKSGQKQNHPALLPEIIQTIAQIKNQPEELVTQNLWKNGNQAFGWEI